MYQVNIFFILLLFSTGSVIASSWCETCICLPWMGLINCNNKNFHQLPTAKLSGYKQLTLDYTTIHHPLNISLLLSFLPDLTSITASNSNLCYSELNKAVILVPDSVKPCFSITLSSRTPTPSAIIDSTSTFDYISTLSWTIQPTPSNLTTSLLLSTTPLTTGSPTSSLVSSRSCVSTTNIILPSPKPTTSINNGHHKLTSRYIILLSFTVFFLFIISIWVFISLLKVIKRHYQYHRCNGRSLINDRSLEELEMYSIRGLRARVPLLQDCDHFNFTWNSDDVDSDDDIVIYER